ncbi:MAG: carboxypeptidase regulatory-like domain-containing protein, partial [Deltaproteobacteria bacterium]|nr:carboxypeptidase regulatory-like domain-containing protein [Deltaproteobacteria bacterium]
MKRTTIVLLALVVASIAAWFLWPQVDQGKLVDVEKQVAKPDKGSQTPAPAGRDNPPTHNQPIPRLVEDDDPVGSLQLEGQVLNAENLPVEGARVAISTKPHRTITTEKDGTFVFEKLVGKRYRLTARLAGKVGGPILHKLSAKSDPVIIRLRSSAEVEVTVVDQKEKTPIPGALVELRTIDKVVKMTDSDGKAKLSGVPAGYSTLVAVAKGYSPAHQLLMVPDSTVEPLQIRMSLQPGVSVTGRVTDDQHNPIARATVLAVDTSLMIPLSNADQDGTQTDEQGRFVISAISPATYRFSAHHKDYTPASSKPITVVLSRPTPDVVIVMRAGASLSGRVVSDSGQVVAWAGVRCSKLDGTPFSGSIIGGTRQRGATTDEHGEFRFSGLPRAKLVLVAITDQASSPMQTVDLSAKPIAENVVLKLSVQGRIAGRVVTASKEPVPEVEVSAMTDFWASGASIETGLRGRSATVSDGGGNFEFKGLPEGNYRIRASRSAGSFRQYMKAGVQAKTGDENVEVILQSDGSLKGSLVYIDGGRPTQFSVAISYPPGVPVSSQDGSFELSEVAPGTYTITIRGKGFADAQIPDVEIKANQNTDLGVIKVKRGRS